MWRERSTYRRREHLAVSLLLLLALLMAVAARIPTSSALAGAPRAHHSLLQAAASQPDTSISVIVQKHTADAAVEPHLARLGGRLTASYPFIKGFAAELPARSVPALARLDGVRWVSPDAPLLDTNTGCADCLSTSSLKMVYPTLVGASRLWNQSPALQGQGITVAVVDSGITAHPDFGISPTRIVHNLNFNYDETTPQDMYGHGTHVAGIIGGNGASSSGGYIGIAPKVNLLNIKIGDNKGRATSRYLVDALQWIYNNHKTYNIRVVNMSLNSSVYESYKNSPLDAAVEILWFNGVVVVVSAGNSQLTSPGIVYPPANDPFVITVGAWKDNGTLDMADDSYAPWSTNGLTSDGFSKPDVVAPGVHIVSALSSKTSTLATADPTRIINGTDGRPAYLRLSGTSMAAPVVAGAVALLLQDEPGLTPDQVKHRLMATARPLSVSNTGAGMLDIYAAVHGTTTTSANQGLEVSTLLFTGSDSVNWNSVSWGSVAWGSVAWGSVAWGSVAWGSTSDASSTEEGTIDGSAEVGASVVMEDEHGRPFEYGGVSQSRRPPDAGSRGRGNAP